MFISINHILLWTKMLNTLATLTHAPHRPILGITALLLFIALFIGIFVNIGITNLFVNAEFDKHVM